MDDLIALVEDLHLESHHAAVQARHRLELGHFGVHAHGVADLGRAAELPIQPHKGLHRALHETHAHGQPAGNR